MSGYRTGRASTPGSTPLCQQCLLFPVKGFQSPTAAPVPLAGQLRQECSPDGDPRDSSRNLVGELGRHGQGPPVSSGCKTQLPSTPNHRRTLPRPPSSLNLGPRGAANKLHPRSSGPTFPSGVRSLVKVPSYNESSSERRTPGPWGVRGRDASGVGKDSRDPRGDPHPWAAEYQPRASPSWVPYARPSLALHPGIPPTPVTAPGPHGSL